MIICELLAVYGEKKYNVFADANDIHQLSHGRDVRKEAAANQLVRSCFSAYDARKHQMLLQGADEMYEFLSSGHPVPESFCRCIPRRKCTGTSFESGQFWHGGTGRDSFKI